MKAETQDVTGGGAIRQDPRPSMAIWMALAALLLVGIAARSFGLSFRSMFDEAASWRFVTLPWPAFLEVLWKYDGNMVFYYLLLREWLHLGESEVVIRSLSVVFGVATIAVVYALGARMFSMRTGFLAGSFLAVHAFHIRYSQEGRSYALVTLLLALSTLLFLKAIQSRSRLLWVSYVVVSALACYTQLLAVLVLGAQWLWFLWSYGFKGLRERLGVIVALALSVAPMLLYAVSKDAGQIDWIRPLNRWNFMTTVTTLAGYHLVLLLLYGALCALAAYFAFGRGREASRTSHSVLLALWILLPPVTLVIVSQFRPMFVDRYMLMCVPALMLLAAAAVDRLLAGGTAMKAAGVLAALVAIGVSSRESVQQYQEAAGETNWLRNMTHLILTEQQPNDAVIFYTAASHMPFDYYATHAPPAGVTSRPKTIIPDVGGVPTGAQPIPTAAEIESVSTGFDRVWLVQDSSGIRLVPGAKDGLPVMLDTLSASFNEISKTQLGNLTVSLYERKKATLSAL